MKLSLKEIRESTELTQEEFAKKIGLKYGTYVKKESYIRKLNAYELIAISDVTGIDIRMIKIS